MEKRFLTLIAAALVAVMGARAQDDFGIWAEANVEKKLSKRLTLDAGLELRTRDDAATADRWSLGLGASYKLLPWLKAAASYTLIDDHNHKVNSSGRKAADYWGWRHRLNVSLTASQQWGDLSLSLRERWQYTYRPEKTVERTWNYTDDDDDRYLGQTADEHTYRGKGGSKWRNRLQLKYRLTKEWRPYLSAESTVGGSGLDKMRYSVGTELRLSKQHSVDLRYLYQHTYKDDDSEGNRHVIGVGYTFKF